MHRKLEYYISQSEAQFSVKQFLKSRGYSSQNLVQLKKRPECVQVNGRNAYMNHPLAPGDLLTIQIIEEISSQNILPVQLPLDIVYEDEDLIVLNKAAGMPIHPSMKNRDNSVANALAWYFRAKKVPFVFRCINRLDRDTSGLTLIAKHMVSAGILSQNLHNQIAPEDNTRQRYRETPIPPPGIHREYRAIVRGHVIPPEGTICAPLSRKPGSIIERRVDFERGERAVTHYRVLEEQDGYCLVSLWLETGRTHQIRIHMKYLGYPLIGDYLYNPDMEHISRQALHSYRLRFSHPITGTPMEFTAPLPEDMQKFF